MFSRILPLSRHNFQIERVKFGVPLEQVCGNKNQLPGPLLVMILKLNKEAPYKKDVFRAPGHQSNMKKLMHSLQAGRLVNIDTHSVYTIASVLKTFLRKLPGGVFGPRLEAMLFDLIRQTDKPLQERQQQMARLLGRLPLVNQHLLVLLFGTFNAIANCALQSNTGMTSEAIGVSVAPSFFHSCVSNGLKFARMEDVQRFKLATLVTQFLIDNFGVSDLFGRENYEYYARISGRLLRVEANWVVAYKYPPMGNPMHSSASAAATGAATTGATGTTDAPDASTTTASTGITTDNNNLNASTDRPSSSSSFNNAHVSQPSCSSGFTPVSTLTQHTQQLHINSSPQHHQHHQHHQHQHQHQHHQHPHHPQHQHHHQTHSATAGPGSPVSGSTTHAYSLTNADAYGRLSMSLEDNVFKSTGNASALSNSSSCSTSVVTSSSSSGMNAPFQMRPGDQPLPISPAALNSHQKHKLLTIYDSRSNSPAVHTCLSYQPASLSACDHNPLSDEEAQQLNADQLKMVNRYAESTKSLSFLPMVHERQTARMKTRSEWFLNPSETSGAESEEENQQPVAGPSSGTFGVIAHVSSSIAPSVAPPNAGSSSSSSTSGRSKAIVRKNSSKEKRLIRRSSSKKDKENTNIGLTSGSMASHASPSDSACSPKFGVIAHDNYVNTGNYKHRI